MRDGVALATDIYLPTQSEAAPLPVVLERTPYGRRNVRASERYPGRDTPLSPVEVAAELVGRGLAVVMQDCRGCGDSEGEFVKYLREGEDGFDTISWVGRQPWCDGRVATMGLSYCAHTQAALASLNPPHLSAMLMDCGGFASAYETGVRQGGAFELKQVTWALRQVAKKSLGERAGDVSVERSAEVRAWLNRWPWRPGCSPLSAFPEYENYLLEQYEHASFSEYWQQIGLHGRGYYDNYPDVPSLHMSGWYDPYVPTAVENFSSLGASKKSSTYLVIGPWTHGGRSLTYAGDVDFGAHAPLEGTLAGSYVDFRAEWLRQQLDPEPGPETFPPVAFFLMGGGDGGQTIDGRLRHGGRWYGATSWPPRGVETVKWYLHADGTLREQPPVTSEDFVEYDYDPRDPTPTVGGAITSGEPVMLGGAFDQRWSWRDGDGCVVDMPLESRWDVLTFDSHTLDRDVVIAGQCVLRLWVASSVQDTDFCWKLVDVYPRSHVYPHGFAMNITDGMLRTRYRRSLSEPVPMVPSEIYELVIRAPDTANIFKRGHRLRVMVSSSNFPRFDVNRNVWPDNRAKQTFNSARNRVYLDRLRPSRIELLMWTTKGEPLARRPA